MMFMPPGMPQGMPFGQSMPFGFQQGQQQPQAQMQNNPMIQALMQPGQTAPIGQIGMPNTAPPFGTPPWMRPMGK